MAYEVRRTAVKREGHILQKKLHIPVSPGIKMIVYRRVVQAVEWDCTAQLGRIDVPNDTFVVIPKVLDCVGLRSFTSVV